MEYKEKLQSDDYTDKNKEYVISMFVKQPMQTCTAQT